MVLAYHILWKLKSPHSLLDTQKRVEMDEGLEGSLALKPEPEEIFSFQFKNHMTILEYKEGLKQAP